MLYVVLFKVQLATHLKTVKSVSSKKKKKTGNFYNSTLSSAYQFVLYVFYTPQFSTSESYFYHTQYTGEPY